MALSITHTKVSGKPAGSDPDRVYGTHWDAAHTLTGSVSVEQGGTGLTSYTIGDILYASTTTALAKLAGVATGSVLVSGGVGAAPAWSSSPTITDSVTAARFVPSGSTVPTNGMYLPASNTLGWAVNSAAELQLTASALSPAASDGSALGTTSLMWSDLFLASGAVLNFNNGNYTLTHSSGLLTFSAGWAATGTTTLSSASANLPTAYLINSHDGASGPATIYRKYRAGAANNGAVQVSDSLGYGMFWEGYDQSGVPRTAAYVASFVQSVSASTVSGWIRFYAGGAISLEAYSTVVTIPLTTASTAYTNGALTVSGGVGVDGNICLSSSKKFDFGSGNYTVTHASGVLYTSGKFGVGVTPTYRLHVKSDGDQGGIAIERGSSGQKTSITFKNEVGTDGSRIYADGATDDLYFALAGTNALRMDASGLGISVLSSTASTAYTNGALIVSGGLGVALDVFTNGIISSAGAHTALSGTAIPAGGTAGAGYKFSSTSNFGVFFGSGAPSLSAAKGSLYLRSDGSTTNDRAYINTNGSTTWTALTTVA